MILLIIINTNTNGYLAACFRSDSRAGGENADGEFGQYSPSPVTPVPPLRRLQMSSAPLHVDARTCGFEGVFQESHEVPGQGTRTPLLSVIL